MIPVRVKFTVRIAGKFSKISANFYSGGIREFLHKAFALWGQKIHLIRACCHKVKTLEQVKAILG